MGTLAPPVVAVVVAHDPGGWFEETLASLAAQSYAELSVLVLDAGSAEDLSVRVAAVLPRAYVRRFEGNRSFGSSVNEVRSMVEGADYFLLCHDDVALFPDAVQLMVEEAFRSNAGIVSPKVVSWDDPEQLVHVGMTVDKGGSVVDRIQPHEIDHGQHDAVRDVFVAPGGSTLVRADLFAELGGYDTAIVAMGEDLDLCWRAQVAGARVIIAPDARVRHLEALAGGSRVIDPALVEAGAGGRRPRHPITLQELQRRHELLAVLKCYGPLHLLRVVPQVFFLAVGEIVVAELAGNRVRARAVRRAWRWNLGRLSVLRRQRKELRARRRLSDREIRALQIGGSARLVTYGRRVVQHGFQGAHADELAASGSAAAVEAVARRDATGTGSIGPPPAPAVAGAVVSLSARGRINGRARLAVWLAAVLIVLVGTRGIITGRLPVVGQFVPFPNWSSMFTQFAAGWQPSGVGTTAPASPALALAGLAGTVLLGAMGSAQKVLVLACVPLGVWGVVRLLRPFRSQRAALVAGLSYLAMALAYDNIALGRWGALVAYAGTPWVLARLFRATGTAPFVALRPTGAGNGSEPGALRSVRRRVLDWSVRHETVRAVVALGLIEAVLISFVPAAAVTVVLVALALVLSSALQRDWWSTLRALALALAATLVAVFICLPWVIGVLTAGRGAVTVFGVPVPGSEGPSWASLLRFAVGPIGTSPLAWGFVLAAVVPLVLARGARFRWAVRLWSIALVSWLAAWVIGRGWTGRLAIDPHILLAPAAASVAAAIGLGAVAFEEDLHAAVFGWRQVVTVLATAAVVLGAIPTLVSALPGRWDLPETDFSQSVAWMGAKSADGAFRVLWLGDSRVLNQGAWAAGNGLAYATSEDGGPDARWLWSAPGPGPAAGLSAAVDLARAGGTDQLGRLLAPSGVRYIVLVTSLAPEIPGEQTPVPYPAPADLAPALGRQLDLSSALSGSGITVYENADWLPQRAQVGAGSSVPASAPPAVPGSAPGSGILPGARPVLPGPRASTSYGGPLTAGSVFSASAPAGRWLLSGRTGTTAPSPAFGWAGQYHVTRRGDATLRFDGGAIVPLSLLYSIVAWLLAVALIAGTRLGRPWPMTWRRRRPATAGADPPDRPGEGRAVEPDPW
ncbi:MAG: glycosyltransferase [Acidimicrobiales bacterium]